MTANANETGTAAGAYAPPAAASGSPDGTPVSLRNLTRAFGATKALDGMSLDIAPGELIALLGPSGCGKTTALRIVAGFEYADSGEVLVNGKDVSGVPASKRDMGMVFQSYSLFPNMSALDNVGFGLRMRKTGAAKRRSKALLQSMQMIFQNPDSTLNPSHSVATISSFEPSSPNSMTNSPRSYTRARSASSPRACRDTT